MKTVDKHFLNKTSFSKTELHMLCHSYQANKVQFPTIFFENNHNTVYEMILLYFIFLEKVKV